MKKLLTTIICFILLSNVYSQTMADPLKIQGFWLEDHMGSVSIGWDGTHYIIKTDQYQAIQTKLENNIITYKYPNPDLASNRSLPQYITGRITKKSKDIIVYNNVEYSKVRPLDSDLVVLLTSDFSNFNTFYSTFKKTVLNNNVQKVSTLLDGMINFPFIDFYKKAYNEVGLSCNYSSDFEKNYSLIFTPDVLTALKSKTATKLNPEDLTELEKNIVSGYALFEGYPSLLFGKVNGRYMLLGIKYLE